MTGALGRTTWVSWVVFFVAVAAFVILFWLFARSLSRTIILVSEGAGRFAQGDIRLEGMDWEDISKINRRQDELGDTGRAFAEFIEYMQEKVDAAGKIASGNLDLDIKVASEADALGRALASMVANLNKVLSQANLAAEQVANGAGQISDSSQALSQGATEQAASLEEITSSMTETELPDQAPTPKTPPRRNQLSAQARERRGKRQRTDERY